MEVTIRIYERRDAAGVADVFYRSVREVALSDYTPEQVRAWVPGRWDAEREHRRSGDGRLDLVAEDEPGHVVAFIDLEPDGHIDRLFCAPEVAGRGVASRLYDAIETAARAQGIQRVFTEASELARRFFERKGFTVLGRQGRILRGVPIHNYRMAKTLGYHEGRHTAVSIMSSNGVQIQDISDTVGHKSTHVTETVYRHVIVPEIRGGATVTDNVFHDNDDETV